MNKNIDPRWLETEGFGEKMMEFCKNDVMEGIKELYDFAYAKGFNDAKKIEIKKS